MIDVRLNDNGTLARLRRVSADVEKDVLGRAMERAGRATLNVLKEHFRGAPESIDPFWGVRGGAGSTLGKRSGLTIQRLAVGEVIRSGGDARVSVGSPDPYVKKLDEGGELTTGRFFRIPTAAAQTARGVDRNLGRSVRGQANLFVLKTKRALWIVENTARGIGARYGAGAGRTQGRLTFLYLLTRSIHFRPRGMFEAARAEAEPIAARIMGEEVAVLVAKANA
jgi:hypothetical protein